MRKSDDVRRAYDQVGNRPELLRWRGDNFRYGMLVGKLIALGWTLGEEASADLSIDYDFESWMREVHVLGEDIGQRLDSEEPENPGAG
jgi:hypothetical protein